jgi:hypothetical protein
MEDAELGAGKSCFVIGPIGDKLEPVGTPGKMRYEEAARMWENVFEPACDTFGLTAVRADKISEPGEIPKQIFTYLKDADIVIADVSNGNANVMYELGLRHTRDKITIQIGEHERLPFDVNTIRTIKFKRTESGLIDARQALVESLRTALDGNFKPVTATEVWRTLGELTAEEVQIASTASRESDDDILLDDDKEGRLELLVTAEEAMGELSDLLQQLTDQITEAGEQASEYSPPLQAAKSFGQRLVIVKKFASAMEPIAAQMDDVSDRYFTRVEQAGAMTEIVTNELAEDGLPDESEALEAILSYLEAVVGLAKAAAGSRPNMSELRKSIRELRRISKELIPFSKSMEASLNRVIAGTDAIIGWGELARPIIEAAQGDA